MAVSSQKRVDNRRHVVRGGPRVSTIVIEADAINDAQPGDGTSFWFANKIPAPTGRRRRRRLLTAKDLAPQILHYLPFKTSNTFALTALTAIE